MRRAGRHALRGESRADVENLSGLRGPALRAQGGRSAARRNMPTRSSRWWSSEPSGFRVERWNMNAAPPPFHRRVVRNDDAVDRCNRAVMHVPGVFFMETLFAPAGSGAEKGQLRGARSSTATASSSRRKHAQHALLLELPARLRPARPDHRHVVARQHGRRLHGGQGDHRGPAAGAQQTGFVMHPIVVESARSRNSAIWRDERRASNAQAA